MLASLRLLLEEPKLADLVIADLARWQDWSAIDRLVELFEQAEADNIFVREPIVNYLRACPLPQAADAIAKLEKIDPEAVRRATLAAFSGAIGSGSATTETTAETAGKEQKAPSGGNQNGDPGDPTVAGVTASGSGDAPSQATDATTASQEEVAIAARIPAVLADEEATDDAPGIDPTKPLVSPPAPAVAPKPAATGARPSHSPRSGSGFCGGHCAPDRDLLTSHAAGGRQRFVCPLEPSTRV